MSSWRCRAVPVVVAAAIVFLVFFPRLDSLRSHLKPDEPTWLSLCGKFASALRKGDFSGTLLIAHPGLPTLWLGGLGLSAGEALGEEGDAPYVDRLARARRPVALATGLALLLLAFLLGRLLGRELALLGTLLLVSDALLLSESRRLSTDALTTLLLATTLVSWLCYLEGGQKRSRDLFLAGASFGLACINKSIAAAFLLLLPPLLAWHLGLRTLDTRRALGAVLLAGAVTLGTFAACCPCFWTWRSFGVPVAPLLVLFALPALIAGGRRSCFSLSGFGFLAAGLSLVLIACVVPMRMDDLRTIREVILAPYEAIRFPVNRPPLLFLGEMTFSPNALFYPVYALYWSAPLAWVLIAGAIGVSLRNRSARPVEFRVVCALVGYGLFWILGLSIAGTKLPRYLILSSPAWVLLQAMGILHLGRWVASRGRSALLGGAVVVLVVFAQAFPVLRLHPDYAAYFHPFLTKRWVLENTSTGEPIGLDLAAEYLNRKEDARHMRVLVETRSWKLFAPYFVGTAHTDPRRLQDREHGYDYIVDDLQNPQDRIAPETGEREKVIERNGIPRVGIYRVRRSPDESR